MKRKLTTIAFFVLLTLTIFAQSSVFKITFSSEGTNYKGVLLAYDDVDWLLRLKYYDASCACYHIIQEYMRVEVVNSLGYKLRGYSVKDVVSGRYVTSDVYAADNFYFYTDDYGDLRLTNIDNQYSFSEVSIQKVRFNEMNTVLYPVKWTYDSYNGSVVNVR